MLTQTFQLTPYWQYQDDQDIQALFAAINQVIADHFAWMQNLNLPIWIGTNLTGALLDWIANGLYGQSRPLLSSDTRRMRGLYNSINYNQYPYKKLKFIDSQTYYATSDDIFKRVLTWNMYVGDGFRVTPAWVKRRVKRFLNGTNGTDISQSSHYQISLTFAGTTATITLYNGIRTVTKFMGYNCIPFNTLGYNKLNSTLMTGTSIQYAQIFQSAVASGALNLPFEYNWTVNIIG
jgi:hypothetical protein